MVTVKHIGPMLARQLSDASSERWLKAGLTMKRVNRDALAFQLLTPDAFRVEATNSSRQI